MLLLFFLWSCNAETICPNVLFLPFVECPEGLISIRGLNPTDVLWELWWNTRIPGYTLFGPEPPYDDEAAERAVKGYIDYFLRKPIKMDLSKECINPRLYNRDSLLWAESLIESLHARMAQQCQAD